MTNNVKDAVSSARTDDVTYEKIYKEACTMAHAAGTEGIQMPRRCDRQTQRNNVPAYSPKQYVQKALFNPCVDSFIQQLGMRFNTMTKQATLALCLIPNNIDRLDGDSIELLASHYKDDMPQPDAFHQELELWKRAWNSTDMPSTITAPLERSCRIMYPNIMKILTLILLTSVTAASVERSNSTLRFIKTCYRSTMGQGRFNVLMLLFVHRDIELDLDAIVTLYAQQYPRRMLLHNPMVE